MLKKKKNSKEKGERKKRRERRKTGERGAVDRHVLLTDAPLLR